jgi:hypothetical protein
VLEDDPATGAEEPREELVERGRAAHPELAAGRFAEAAVRLERRHDAWGVAGRKRSLVLTDDVRSDSTTTATGSRTLRPSWMSSTSNSPTTRDGPTVDAI